MMKDAFDFEIEGYDPKNTPDENIKALEAHQNIIDGLHNESSHKIDKYLYKELERKNDSPKTK